MGAYIKEEVKMKRFLSLVMCAVLAVSLCACAGKSAVSKDENLLADYKKSESLSEYDFLSGEDIMPEGYEKYSDSVTDFSLQLFAENLSDDENAVLSPYSVVSAMSLLMNGADGDTLAQMKSVMAKGTDLGVINESNRYLTSRLSAFNNEEGEFFRADSLWLDDSFDVKASFLQSVVNYYDAGVIRTPLSDTAAKDKINGWISEQTKGKITDMAESINPDTRAMIINAVLMDDKWTTPYTQDDLLDGTFRGTQGDTDATFMCSKEFYISSSHAEGFVKSFKNLPLKFAAVVPVDDIPLTEFANTLSASKLNALIESQKPTEFCRASLPEFSVKNKLDLKESLVATGIEDAFDDVEADFSSLTNTGDIHIGSVNQEAFVEVGPQGACAGAATVVELADTASPQEEEMKELVLDRPFLFIIFDNESNIPVFMGAVNNIGANQ